jgi:hypothetical protein
MAAPPASSSLMPMNSGHRKDIMNVDDAPGAVARALGVAVAAALAVDAYVHLHDAPLYTPVASSTVSQATLFRIEAGAAIVVAVALLAWPRPLVWALALVVTAGGVGAVLLYTHVDVGQIAFLPNMYEPTWNLPGKLTSAWFEGVGAALAACGLAWSIRGRAPSRGTHRA